MLLSPNVLIGAFLTGTSYISKFVPFMAGASAAKISPLTPSDPRMHGKDPNSKTPKPPKI
jgi:hypothetical protein